MHTVFISGIIFDKNNELFTKAATALTKVGIKAVNPVTIKEFAKRQSKDPIFQSEIYMKESLKLLLQSDGIMMLPGWKDSKESVVEHYVAKACGKTFVKIKELDDKWGRD